MPFVPINQTAKLDFIYNHLGQVMVNSMYIRDSTGWDQAKLQTLMEDGADWWSGHMDVCTSSACELVMLRARDYTTETGYVMEYQPSSPIPGTDTGEPYPGNVSSTIKFQTGYAGKTMRGRWYFVGMTENAATGNALNPVWRAATYAAAIAITTDIATGTREHVIASKYYMHQARIAAMVTPVVNYAIDPVVRCMRRRLTGVGS